MNTPIEKINPVTPSFTPIEATNDGERKFYIQLDKQRAASWIVCIEELSSGCQNIELEPFLDELSDACWLARWKREDALVKFDPLLFPGLVAALSSERAIESRSSTVVEDIIQTLSRCRTQ